MATQNVSKAHMATAPLFVPSSNKLLAMIAAAEAKFAVDREQTALRKEARRDALNLRVWIAAEQTKQRIRRWGC